MTERSSAESVDRSSQENEVVGAPLRDHVTFRVAGGLALDPAGASLDLIHYVRSGNKDRSPPIKLRQHVSYSGVVTVRVSRHSQHFHTITFSSMDDARLVARHNVALGRELSLMLHEWLTESGRFTDICWRTREQWRNGEPGTSQPIDHAAAVRSASC